MRNTVEQEIEIREEMATETWKVLGRYVGQSLYRGLMDQMGLELHDTLDRIAQRSAFYKPETVPAFRLKADESLGSVALIPCNEAAVWLVMRSGRVR
jgi:hypothetical protein